jgi:hypothetical protein
MYHPDLSKRPAQRNTFNVGWLHKEHPFPKYRPPKWLLTKLWLLCHYPTIKSACFHECDLPGCPGPSKKIKSPFYQWSIKNSIAHENKISKGLKSRPSAETLEMFAELFGAAFRRPYTKVVLGISPDLDECPIMLGDAEMRVFGPKGRIYAAPNMLYHYVRVHHYKPPDEFLQALKNGPFPPDPKYLSKLPCPFSEMEEFKRRLCKERLRKRRKRRRNRV